MDKWQQVFRFAIAPSMSVPALRAALAGVAGDDLRMVQGATVIPTPHPVTANETPEMACLVGYAGWKGDGLKTVEQVEDYFAKITYVACDIFHETGAIRHFLNWFDDRPRREVFAALAKEIRYELELRACVALAATVLTGRTRTGVA